MAQATRPRTPARGPEETQVVIREGKAIVRMLRRDANRLENLPLGLLIRKDPTAVEEAFEMISSLRKEADEIEVAIAALATGSES